MTTRERTVPSVPSELQDNLRARPRRGRWGRWPYTVPVAALVVLGLACSSGEDTTASDRSGTSQSELDTEGPSSTVAAAGGAAVEPSDPGDPPPLVPVEAAAALLMTAADVGLPASEWTATGASGYDSAVYLTPCDSVSSTVQDSMLSFAEAGNTSSLAVAEQLAVFDSATDAQTAFAEAVGVMSTCDDYSPSGPVAVTAGTATGFIDTSDDAIIQTLGVVDKVVFNIASYGSYDPATLAVTAASRASAS